MRLAIETGADLELPVPTTRAKGNQIMNTLILQTEVKSYVAHGERYREKSRKN